MSGSITDLVDRVTDNNSGRPVVSTLAAPGKAIGASSINLSDATNWTTSSAIHFSIYKTNAQGYKDVTTQTDWKGVLAGTTISNLTLTGGTDQAYNAGDIVEITPTSRFAKDLFDAVTKDHDTQGRHKQLTDTNGNKIMGTNPVASAVNDFLMSNAATGGAPALVVEGSDTDVDAYYGAKGKGSPRFYGNHDGWVLDTDAWTYISATSFKITGKNVTARFPVGTKIKVIQSGSPVYFYVTGATFSTDTTVTLTGGSDYSLAAGFTIPMYSYASTPQGFPTWFNYTPTYTNLTIGSGTVIARFRMIGKDVRVKWMLTCGTGTVVGTGPELTFPVTPASFWVNEQVVGPANFVNVGTDIYLGSVVYFGGLLVLRYASTTGAANPAPIHSSSATTVDATHPFAFSGVNHDVLAAEFEYETA